MRFPREDLTDPLRETEPELVVPHEHAGAIARGVFAPLFGDHDLKRGLLRAFTLADTRRARDRALGRLQRFVRIHDRAEHSTVYGALLAEPPTRRLAQVAIDEHHALDATLGELAEATAARAEARMTERLGRYRDLLTVHLLREEEELFPLAYDALGPERCLRLVGRFRDARRAAGAYERG